MQALHMMHKEDPTTMCRVLLFMMRREECNMMHREDRTVMPEVVVFMMHNLEVRLCLMDMLRS